MANNKAGLVVSKAGKPKNRKFDVKERYSMGHGIALLPEGMFLEMPRERSVMTVYRSPTFGMSRADRIEADAQHLLDKGLAETVDEAVEKAMKAVETNRGPEIKTTWVDKFV